MAAIYFVLASVLLAFSTSSAQDSRELVMILDEPFDTFNLSLWKHEITLAGGGNWEFQAYLNNRTSSFVRDGKLYIKPVLMEDEIGIENVKHGYTYDVWGDTPADYCTQNEYYGCSRTSAAYHGGNYLNPIKSARLRTAESFSFRYGKIELRARLPRGDWLWPSVRLFPRYNAYGPWPASGDMIMIESRGNSPAYPPGGYDRFSSVLHWGHSHMTNNYDQTLSPQNPSVGEFHTYGLLWNETYIGTYFDDESNPILSVPIDQSFWSRTGLGDQYDNPWVGRPNVAPFDQEFYLVMNVACGGVNPYFPDGYGKPWNNSDGNAVNKFYDAKEDWYPTWDPDTDNSALQVDWLKVWTYKDSQRSTVGRSPVDISNGSGFVTASFLCTISAILLAVFTLVV